MDVELTEIRDFLAGHAPFDALPPKVLNELPARMSMRYARRGTPLLELGTRPHELLILRSGATDTHDDEGALVERNEEGTSYGFSSLLDDTPMRFRITANEDSLVLALPREDFRELCETQAAFQDFYVRRRSGIRAAADALHRSSTGTAVLRTRVRDMLQHPPLTVEPDISVQVAAQLMTEHRHSAVMICEGPKLVGILTDRDLRRRVLADGLDSGYAVRTVMTPDPVTVGIDAHAVEVLLTMVNRGVHHLPVVEDGRPVGMITLSDLIRLEQTSPAYVAGEISHQKDLAGLVEVSRRVPVLVTQLVDQDASADDIQRIISAVGDEFVRALLRMAEAELGPPPVPYCYVVLGSLGRHEYGLSSDQDNAIILDDSTLPADHPYFERLAISVRDGLIACGYPSCPGDVMATNPRWRAPLAQWKRHFAQWIYEPTSESVLNAQIFFDMRAIHGETRMVERLQEEVLGATRGNMRFLGHLAKQAAARQPPLGFFRGFVLQKTGSHRDTLDLKAGGIAALVEIARVYALANGLPQLNTLQRFAAAAEAGVLGEDAAADLGDAFEFISYVRLRNQARQIRAGAHPDNHVSPDDLSAMEKRHLREAFGVIRTNQEALAYSYRTSYIS